MANHKSIAHFQRRVRLVLQQGGIGSGRLLVVAVSGGPDSLALLYALNCLRDELGLRLHGAHLDHGLRGDASKADARFVAETFASLGIPCTLGEADVAALRQERKLSLEAAAREARYAFLSRVAESQGADAVALGHTADDQAETVLMHIIRGSGLTGIRGMERVSRRVFDGAEIVVVRPLLDVSRQETLEYCRALKLEPRLDESNLSLELTRNRIRLELLPLLERYNPAVRDALVRLSRSAARDLAFIEAQVDTQWDRMGRSRGDGVVLDMSDFSQLPPSLQDHMLRRALSIAKGNLEEVEQNHIDDMARLMAGPAGKSLDLPGGIRFSVGYAEATLTASPIQSGLPPLAGEHRLNVPGETLIPGWRITARVVQQAQESGPCENEPDHSAELDYDSVGGALWVRPRRPGDRFQPLGMAQAKKLQDFMVDSKIPRAWRDRVPLVVSPRGIAWVVGWRIAEWARVREDGSPQLALSFARR